MRLNLFLAVSAMLGATTVTHALSISRTYTPGALIPDETASGVQFTESMGTGGSLLSVSLDLHITAAPGSDAFLGDLYAYLQHGDDRVPLLNRPGRDIGRSFGYDDNQALNVSFSGSGLDIHSYRPDPNIPLLSTLAGTWAPDGRATDPLFVLASDPRTMGFGQFRGEEASGDWTLFVADLSSGAEHQVIEWTLNLEIAESVPEGGALFLASGLLWGGMLYLARRR